jgi:hypothetical protein
MTVKVRAQARGKILVRKAAPVLPSEHQKSERYWVLLSFALPRPLLAPFRWSLEVCVLPEV